jgi:TonB family protein
VSVARRLLPVVAPAFLFAGAPAAAIPPAISEPEEQYPLAFEEWKGACLSQTVCWASRPWADAEISISIEPAQPYGIFAPRPAYIRYRVRRPCQGAELGADLALPIADFGDVAAHLLTAMQNEDGPCRTPGIDGAMAASITRLVRLFTLAGGIAAPLRDGPPGDPDYNRHPINPDIWIDEVADYPPSARDRRQGGRVAVQLSIRDDFGRPVGCDVTESSGVAALDEATCRLLMKNARFRIEPKPGLSHYTHRTVWDIGAVPVPFCVLCEVGPDGVRRPQLRDSHGRRIRRPKTE